jgi:hypothetical protein
MSTDADNTGHQPPSAAGDAFRRYFLLRIMSLMAAVLMLAAAVFLFVLKNSTSGLIGSCAAVVVFFVAFQILHRKRRASHKLWLRLSGRPQPQIQGTKWDC